MRAWVITKDYLSESNSEIVIDDGKNLIPIKSRTDVGVTGPSNADPELIAELDRGGGYAFIMRDDDGFIYYHGHAIWSDDDVEAGAYGPLGDFGMPNAGCTSITYPRHSEYNCG
jgi:hypothetical protein